MQTTVSDILLFQKCPYAWHAKEIFRRQPRVKPKALALGTDIHKSFQTILEECRDKQVVNYASFFATDPFFKQLPESDIANFTTWLKATKVVHVEKAMQVDIGGHTIFCRPDAIIEDEKQQTGLFQLKSCGANRAHHAELVRFSVYECVYQYAINQAGKACTSTLLARYIKTATPRLLLNQVIRTKGDIMAALNYIKRICAQMEEMTLGKETEGWQTPPSCIDWTTGQQCGYFSHCHHGVQLTDTIAFEPTEDRYQQQPSGTSDDQPPDD